MSLYTLFAISHHCLDEILTFLKHNVLSSENEYPKNSYKIKTMLGKLGLLHEAIRCCDCSKTLYWRENANLTECSECRISLYIDGSRLVPLKVFRYFSLIKRLQRMYRSSEIAKHMRWHSTNHSQDNKMRLVVDSGQWRFIDEKFPSFSYNAQNIKMGFFGWAKSSQLPILQVFSVAGDDGVV